MSEQKACSPKLLFDLIPQQRLRLGFQSVVSGRGRNPRALPELVASNGCWRRLLVTLSSSSSSWSPSSSSFSSSSSSSSSSPLAVGICAGVILIRTWGYVELGTTSIMTHRFFELLKQNCLRFATPHQPRKKPRLEAWASLVWVWAAEKHPPSPWM